MGLEGLTSARGINAAMRCGSSPPVAGSVEKSEVIGEDHEPRTGAQRPHAGMPSGGETSRRTATGRGIARNRLWPLSRAGVQRSEVARYARLFLVYICPNIY